MTRLGGPSRFAVILAFGLVYLFWGSTYLAIDIAVQSIPPALMCGVRFSIAGVVMLAVCAATGRRIWYSARQIALAAVVGILLLMGGNLTLVMGGALGAFGAGGADHRHHAVVVSGAGFIAAGPPSHFVAGQSWAGTGDAGAVWFCSGRSCTPSSTLGRRELWPAVGAAWRVVYLGAGIGAVEAVAVGHGRVQRDRLAGDGGRRGELFVCSWRREISRGLRGRRAG